MGESYTTARLYTDVHSGSSGMEPTARDAAAHGKDAEAKRYCHETPRDFCRSIRTTP